jgi:uncharacterized Fe-S center protein
MAASTVYHLGFVSKENGKPRSLIKDLPKLAAAAGLPETIADPDLVAIKLSFSEWGNAAHLRPQFVRQIVDCVKETGGKPYLTDANTLYRGGRSNAVDHINTAIKNGFGYDTIGAPIIIADGLRGNSFVSIPIGNKYVAEPRVGAEAYRADAFISLAHVHGHDGTGYAGTFKNIGMGLGCRAGKQEIHDQKEAPKVDPKKCTLCGTCVEVCPVDAYTLGDECAVVNESTCIRCGECAAACPTEAIGYRWGDEPGMVQRRMVDYVCAVHCLCWGQNRPPIVPDIGVLASRDPVAVEQASFDLVNRQHAIQGAAAEKAAKPGKDKFRAIYPKQDGEVCMVYAEQIGLGSRQYELVEL